MRDEKVNLVENDDHLLVLVSKVDAQKGETAKSEVLDLPWQTLADKEQQLYFILV